MTAASGTVCSKWVSSYVEDRVPDVAPVHSGVQARSCRRVVVVRRVLVHPGRSQREEKGANVRS